MHGLVALFLEVIALAIILLFVGIAALQVLVVVLRKIVASITSMTVETLGDPYRGKTPLPSVPNYQEQDLSRHLIQTDTSNRYKYFSFPANGNHMKLSQPIIATE